MGLSAAYTPTGGGACGNSVSRTATHRRVNFSARPKIGIWEGIFWRGFNQKVDQREALMLMCSSARMEVARKSRE